MACRQGAHRNRICKGQTTHANKGESLPVLAMLDKTAEICLPNNLLAKLRNFVISSTDSPCSTKLEIGMFGSRTASGFGSDGEIIAQRAYRDSQNHGAVYMGILIVNTSHLAQPHIISLLLPS